MGCVCFLRVGELGIRDFAGVYQSLAGSVLRYSVRARQAGDR